MIARFPSIINWFFLGLLILITVMSFYQAWENLINKKFSRFSFDAMMLTIINKFGSGRTRKQAKASAKDSTRILLLGIYAFLLGVGGLYEIIHWFNIFTWR